MGARFLDEELCNGSKNLIKTDFEGGRHLQRIKIRYMNLENIKRNDMDVYNIIESELARQRNTLELIASENFTSKSVLEAVGSVLTNKYAEGYSEGY